MINTWAGDIKSRNVMDDLELVYDPENPDLRGLVSVDMDHAFSYPTFQEDLNKMIGHIKFPRLGVANIPSEPYRIQTKQQGDLRHFLFSPESKERVSLKRRFSLIDNFARMGGGFMYNDDEDRRHPIPSHQRRLIGVAMGSDTGNPLEWVVAHETQHGVFARISDKYGNPARRALATYLLRSLPHYLYEKAEKFAKLAVYADEPEDLPEETIAYFQNYLQDSWFRESVNRRLYNSNHKVKWRDIDIFHDDMKRAWKYMVNTAKTIDNIDSIMEHDPLSFAPTTPVWNSRPQAAYPTTQSYPTTTVNLSNKDNKEFCTHGIRRSTCPVCDYADKNPSLAAPDRGDNLLDNWYDDDVPNTRESSTIQAHWDRIREAKTKVPEFQGDIHGRTDNHPFEEALSAEPVKAPSLKPAEAPALKPGQIEPEHYE